MTGTVVVVAALSDPANPNFMHELTNSPANLQATQSVEFFANVMGHFRNSRKLQQQQGNRILTTIQALLDKEYHREAFIAGDHALGLPYNDPRFLGAVLNIFLKIVNVDPQAITTEIANAFAQLIPKDPTKSLILIATYAKKFADIQNPWGLLDLLFRHSTDFANPDIVGDYIRLLCYLCYEFTEYREARVKHCWNQISSMLVSDDITTITYCYDALCALLRFNPDGILHIDVLSVHLASEETVESALSILSLRQLGPRNFSQCPQFLPNLICAATRTVHATLVLMDIAKGHNGALKVLEDPQWLLRPLPQLVDTVRLFLVVFHHKSLRAMFLTIPQFFPFLRILVGLRDRGILAVVATVLRRLPANAEHVHLISESRLLHDLADVASALHDRISLGAALLVADSVGNIAFVEELVEFCDIIADCAGDAGDLGKRASFVAARLAKYPECRAILSKCNLGQLFDERQGDPQIQKANRNVRKNTSSRVQRK
jgi:hypothetical protein